MKSKSFSQLYINKIDGQNLQVYVCVWVCLNETEEPRKEREKKKRHNVNGVFPWARRRRIWKFLSESTATGGNRMDVPASGERRLPKKSRPYFAGEFIFYKNRLSIYYTFMCDWWLKITSKRVTSHVKSLYGVRCTST